MVIHTSLPVIKIDGAEASAIGGTPIHFTGRIVWGQTLADGKTRTGIAIEGFGSDLDSNNYVYLLHDASNLLQGETRFNPRLGAGDKK